MDDGEDRCLNGRGTLLQDLDQEAEHVEGEVAIEVVQVLDHALGPLERLPVESPPGVEGHDCGQVLQFLVLGVVRNHVDYVLGAGKQRGIQNHSENHLS